jgi:hypothetical protein
LFWCAPIAIVWANSHGSFLLGPIIAGIVASGEAMQGALGAGAATWRERLRGAARAAAPFVICGLAMAFASLMNPLGVSLLHFALTLSTSEVTKTSIREWNPTFAPDFVVQPAFILFVIALAGTAVLVIIGRRRVRIADVLLLIAFAGLAMTRNRFLVYFGFAALPACARAFGKAATPSAERRRLAGSALLSAVGLAVALRAGNAYGAYPYFAPSNYFSEPMTIHLTAPSLKGNVYNSYELGAELIYRAWPRLLPSMDSRIDSYGDAYFLDQHYMLTDEARLRRFVEQYDVQHMLLLWRDFKHISEMPRLRQDGWRLKFGDHKMVLLTRVPM